jgi:hypothetical protein
MANLFEVRADDDRGRGAIGGFSPNSVLDSRWFILAFLGISWLPDLLDVERDESIDILFTDINLPDGPDAIDGLELARKAVELCPSLRVIYTTGHGQTQPYTVNSLLKQFWRLLRKTSVDNNFSYPDFRNSPCTLEFGSFACGGVCCRAASAN